VTDPEASFQPTLPGDLPPLRPTLVRGQGVHVWDVDGHRYLDAISGSFCVQLGYGRRDLEQALAGAAATLPFARPSAFESVESEGYARELLAAAGAPFTHVILTSSGSEAVEAAYKVAYFSQVMRLGPDDGNRPRASLARLRGHFHGATVEALRATDVQERRAPYEWMLGPGHPALDPSDEPALARGLANAVALIAETVPAVGLGVVVPPPGALQRIRRACDDAQCLWIADEVLTGFGRSGPLFAWQRLTQRPEDRGAVPDIVTFGKGAGAGYAALGGVLLSERLVSLLYEGSHSFSHRQTYGGHALACAVGRRVLAAMREEGIEARVREMEPGLEDALMPLKRHGAVRDVRGIGFLWGVILHDRNTEEPFPRRLRVAERVEARCRERGMLIYGGAGSWDGERGDHLLVAPPLTAEPHHFVEIAAGLRQVLDEVLRDTRSPGPAPG